MKLAYKLTLAIAVSIILVLASYTTLQLRHEVALFEGDAEKSVVVMRAMRAGVEAAWRLRGPKKARVLVEKSDAGAPDIDLSLIPLEPPPADPAHPVLRDAANVARLRAGDMVRVVRRADDGHAVRYTYLPLSRDLQPPTALAMVESLARQESYIHTTHREILLTTLAAILVSALAVLGLGAWLVGRPISRLRDKARAIGAGEFGTPLDVRQHDEIGELADEINHMCARLVETQRRLAQEADARIVAIEQLRHTDRLTTMGQLASGVAHELGTPLSVIAGRADLLAGGGANGDEVVRNARIIVEQAEQMTSRIRQLLDFARRGQPERSVVDLRAVAARTVDMLAPLAARRRTRLRLDDDGEPLVVAGDENQLQQALTNLVVNGVQASPPGGVVTVSVVSGRAAAPADRQAVPREVASITVADEGPGIAPEQLPHVFEPFFTTKPVGEGTGLGLSVALGIVQDHGGWIAVDGAHGRGAQFTIHLPRVTEPDALRRVSA